MSAAFLYEDIFEVLVVDPDGKRFDKGGSPLTCMDPLTIASTTLSL